MIILQVINVISKYALLCVVLWIMATSIFLLAYFLAYKKLMSGKVKLKFKKIGLYSIFIVYIFMLIEVTIMSRDPLYGGISIEVFTSYKNALHSGESTNIILNILMFVPLGFILPLLFSRCKKWYITYLLGLCATLFIEIMQFITMRGIFEVDDIINNFMGCAIGYGLVMIFIVGLKRKSINTKKIKKELNLWLN